MLNLLIISNNSKALQIQKYIQPLIKAKIDVVGDFDHGLKDVFEKRPATVIIQEQIAGVTGESVARHIQLLLGGGAPTFIMLHEGNTRIKAVKGLFELLIDLDLPEENLIDEVLSSLKQVIGDEWDKVAVPPPPKASSVRVVSAHVPEVDRDAADKLVEDFLSDLGASNLNVQDRSAGTLSDDPTSNSLPTADEHAALLITTDQNSGPLRPLDAELTSSPQKQKEHAAKRALREKTPKTAKPKSGALAAMIPDSSKEANATVVSPPDETFEFPALDPVPIPEPPAAVRSDARPEARTVAPVMSPPKSHAADVSLPSPAEFRINGSGLDGKELLPEDILLAFDQNYKSRSRFWALLAVALVVLACVGGGWYLYQGNPQLFMFRKTSSMPVPGGASGSASPVKPASPAAVPVVQKTITSASGPAMVVPSPLPSFVMASGRDHEYSQLKPGWERYIDPQREIRIYRSAGKIRAIQVVAAKGQVIDDAFMRSALQEVAGSSAYSLLSRELKQGVVIQRCSLGENKDLLVYRIQPSDAISAFVVSLE